MENICRIVVSDEKTAKMLRAALILGGIKCADDGGILVTDSLDCDLSDISRVIFITDEEVTADFPLPITVLRIPLCFDELIEAASVHDEHIGEKRAADERSGEAEADGIEVRDGCIAYRGATIRLTEQEFRLFEYLYSRQGEVVSRRELRDALWSDAEEGTNVTDVYISYLRRKLRPFFGEGALLTIRGRGYVLKLG